MQCATHPDVETELGCGRCGKAICPRCLVYTPVGTRCRDCAQVKALPTYNLGTQTLVRASVAAAVVGAGTGVIWWLFNALTYGFIFVLLIGFALGYMISEAVSLAANRKLGPPLQIIAVGGVIFAYLVRTGLLIVVDGWGFDELRLIDAFALLAVVFAGVIAVQRLR